MALVVGLSRLKLRLHVCRGSSTCAVHTKSGCAVAARASSDVLGREYSVFSLNSTLRRSAGLQ